MPTVLVFGESWVRGLKLQAAIEYSVTLLRTQGYQVIVAWVECYDELRRSPQAELPANVRPSAPYIDNMPSLFCVRLSW